MRKAQSLGHHQSSWSADRSDLALLNPGHSASFDPNDEDQIGEPFYKFQQLKRIDPPVAIQFFSQFKIAMVRRMDSEDAELFPTFEARVGKQANGISETMRREHQQIREILNEIEVKLLQADFATDAEERALETALIAHNHREMRVVYSALE